MSRSKRKARQKKRQERHNGSNRRKFIRASDLIHTIEAKTEGQEEYLDSIENNDITICDAPAGTGKTFIAFGKALEYYIEDKNINRIVVARSTMTAGNEPGIGFLPGDLHDKMGPFLAPILKDSARQLVKKLERDREIQSLLGHKQYGSEEIMKILLSSFDIEIVPLQFMRGRTFENSFIILDEAQNCSMSDFKMFLTRIGENSKVIIEGDSHQKDRPDGALVELMMKLDPLETIGCITMDDQDIVRSSLISDILYALEN